jgi:rhodanese-related sulfurtransferase
VSGLTWILLAGAVLALLVIRRIAGGKRVSPIVVLEKIKAGAVILDVRTSGEFQAGAYPGAVNIPVQELAYRLSEVPRDRPVVLYCGVGYRAYVAQRILINMGRANVRNLLGGYRLVQQAGVLGAKSAP